MRRSLRARIDADESHRRWLFRRGTGPANDLRYTESSNPLIPSYLLVSPLIAYRIQLRDRESNDFEVEL